MSEPEAQSLPRLTRSLAFIASAALVAALVHRGMRAPYWLAGLLVVPLIWFGLRWLERRRVRRMMLSGNTDQLMRAWGDALERMPNADTTLPLLQATALAASGLIDRARASLAKASRGSAWKAAYEHRLLLETLLDSFEGDRSHSLEKARELRDLPLPAVAPDLRARIALLREAVAAVARAFAHESEDHDLPLLWEAARRHVLIHWPLRYAAAVVCVDQHRLGEARRLLEGAPPWPEESAFRAFHAEISEHSVESPQNPREFG